MGKRPKKKVVLFLVEGQSDINALSYAIPQFFEDIDENYEVYFPILHDDRQDGGDITSKKGIKPENIEKLIYDLFLHDFLKDYGLYPKDITEIIQIVDLDGAFIPPENVVELSEGNDSNRPVYLETTIETQNVEAIRERNIRKTANLEHLIGLEEIKVASKKVKYSVFYFSANLDHFLHGEANLIPREKCAKADVFSDKCEEDISFFVETFIPASSDLQGVDYYESWEFVKQGCNSLGRYSNLHILLERIIAAGAES